MNFFNKNVLITGGAGFIGSHLADALVEKGCNVRIIDDLSTGHLSNLEQIKNKIEFYKGDIKDQNLVNKVAKDCSIIFHLAAVVSVQQSFDDSIATAMINDIGTLCLLEAARLNGVGKFVFSSSCAIYGDEETIPKKEDMIPNPISPYAIQKFTGEMYASVYQERYNINTVCLRYFNVYGPRQDSSSPYSGVISIFLSKILKQDPPVIYGDGSQFRDFIYVADVVKANILAASQKECYGTSVNIGTSKKCSINSLWKKICKLANIEILPVYKPNRFGDVRESLASIEKALSLLAFRPDISIEEGLQKTYKWYKNNTIKK